MQRSRWAALFTAVLTAGSATTAAGQTFFSANLTPGQETNPPAFTTLLPAAGDPRPVSSGFATFTLNQSQTQLMLMATVFDIDFGGQTPYTTDDLMAAHIHAGPTAVLGQNAGVVWGFFGTPFHDLNSTPAANCTAFATGVGGTCNATWDLNEGVGGLAGQLPNILAGLSYINFHTVQNPGGEIRGALQVVPEPGSVLLLGTGLAGLGLVARRRVRRS